MMTTTYSTDNITTWKLDHHSSAATMGFVRQMEADEDVEEASEQFARDIEAAGWHTGEGMILDGVEFISLVHDCGEPFRIEG